MEHSSQGPLGKAHRTPPALFTARRRLSRMLRPPWRRHAMLPPGRELDVAGSRLRWFYAAALIAIVLAGAGYGALLSVLIKRELVYHDATIVWDFIVASREGEPASGFGPMSMGQVIAERSNFGLLRVDPAAADAVRSRFYERLRSVPGMVMARIFTKDRRIIWSADPGLVHDVRGENERLERVFESGKLEVVSHAGFVDRKDQPRSFAGLLVGVYLPLYDEHGDVVAVTEVFREPRTLTGAIDRANVWIWTCTAGLALCVYLALFGMIRRTEAVLHNQERLLAASDALCVVGEMSAAVAHGIRNPLATIRSSAELALAGTPETMKKNAQDIIGQVDRLGKWVRDLLLISWPMVLQGEPLDIVALVDESIQGCADQMAKSHIESHVERPQPPVPKVLSERVLVTQAIGNVVVNAIEAMPGGGHLWVTFRLDESARRVKVELADTGAGIPRQTQSRLFTICQTTKRSGLGLGMPLVKRIMERFYGSVHVDSAEGCGTRVTLVFRVA